MTEKPRPAEDPRWTEERLADLDPQEHDFQEFKSAPFVFDPAAGVRSDFLDNLSKQVSAFGNAGGGRIFLGLDDLGRIDGGLPRDLKPNGTREWLEDVIGNLVDPHLKEFNVYEVAAEREGSPIRPGQAVYVIDIHESEDAPHQARDHRYYLRIAGKSRPMSHRHVLDILSRSREPDVVVDSIDPYGEPQVIESDPRGPKALLCLRASLLNRGRTLATHVGGEFVLPRLAVNSESRQRTIERGGARLLQRPGELTFFFYHPIPVFPTQEVQFAELWVAIHGTNVDHYRNGRVRCRWRVFADAARVREGQVDLAAYSAVQRGIRLTQRAGVKKR